MLGSIHHVGYLARDLEDALRRFTARFGVEIVRRFERPQFALEGVYLGAPHGDVELFSFTDEQLLERRLGAAAKLTLDHVAYEVSDLAALESRMRGEGVRFAGPDLREELAAPVDLGGTLHLWTVPQTCWGQSLQLLQRLS
ncbi:MAG TPA: VOC family protein [Solirubrobacteraceae bacterium]|jgi:catechol 2,3-dioxygenase-like lactoylglutathione lyase family enzyme